MAQLIETGNLTLEDVKEAEQLLRNWRRKMDAAASHIWQSSVVALVAAALALMLRNNRASVRYWIWFAASMKFLVPFAALSTLASAILWPTSLMPDIETASAAGVLFSVSALPSVSEYLRAR